MVDRKRVLVIGGAGFLGKKITEVLCLRGYEVTVFDAMPKKSPSDFEYICGDICCPEQLTPLIKRCDVVYHLAALADLETGKVDPLKVIYTNVMASANIAHVCAKFAVRLMFASSVYVYSSYGGFYRVSKQSVENIIEQYSRDFSLDYTLLRYGSLYGSGAQVWNGLRKTVNEVLSNDDFMMRGDGSDRREFIHVSDAAELSVDALSGDYSRKAVNITGMESISMTELVQLISYICQKNIQIKYSNNKNKDLRYSISPYQFTPKLGVKLVGKNHIDLGSGILEIIQEEFSK